MRTHFRSTLSLAALAGAFLHGASIAHAAVAENIVYELGAIRIAIPRIETSGSALTDAQLKAILDPASSTSVAQRLGDFMATSVTAPQVVFEIKAGDISNKVIYRDLKLSNVLAGMIESGSVAGAAADIKSPQGEDIKATYGAMSVRKFNLALLVRVMTGRRTDPNEPLATVYEEFTADGFQMTSREAEISLGRMTGAGVKMRALATPISEFAALAQRASAAGAAPGPQEKQAIFAILSDVFQSVEIGKVEALDMKVRTRAPNNIGDFGIGRFVMGGFAKARLAEVAYENFIINMPDGNASIGRIGLRDFDLSRTLAAFADAARRNDLDFKNTNPRNLIPSLGQIQFADIGFDVPAIDGKGNTDGGKRIKFSLGKYEINMSNWIGGIPTAITTSLQKFFMPLPRDSGDIRLQPLIDAGIDRFDISHNIDIAWNEATKEIILKDFSFDMAGVGAMKLSGMIGNAPRELFASSIAQVQAAALGALVKSADFSFENRGVVELGIAQQAKQSGATPEQTKQMIVVGAAMGIPAILGNSPGAKALADALSKFAADPKKLRITARAKEGLGAADMMLLSNPAALMEKLEITATAE